MLYRVFLLVGSLFFLTAAHAQISTLRLNEVLANNTTITNADGTFTDLVEIFNSGDIAVDMEGCSLTDSNDYPRRFVFPPGSIIEANAFHVLRFDSRYTNNPTSFQVPFGIKASGGFLVLYGPETNKMDELEYGLQVQDFSIGRVTDGTGPFLLTIPTLGSPNVEVELGAQSVLSINEWMANNSGGNDYFEIYNPANKPISLGGCHLTDNPVNPTKFRIPDLSYIGTGVVSGYLKFDADSATNKYPADHVNFSLNNNGEAVGLYDSILPTPSPIDFISFGRQTSGVSEGRLPDGQGGIAVQPGSPNRVFFPKINDYDTASPGAPNFLILTNLSINEILTHTDAPLEDAVEILNLGSFDQDLSGWWLSNQRLYPKKYLIPNGAALTPGGFHVIYEGVGTNVGFNGSSAAQPFTFNSAHGDQVVLSQVDANGDLTGYIVYEEFEASANGVSFGHYDTSVPGDYKFVAMSATTFGFDEPTSTGGVLDFRQGTGLTNVYPKVGPIVINEIMFAPSNTVYGTNLVTTQNPEEEYIELRNITSESVPLYDPQYPTNHWKLQRAISFVLPLAELAPNSFCLVVGFDPSTNAAALENFRTRFSLANDIPIFGPWIGQLNDGGDSIELYSPDPVQLPPHPDAGFVPFVRIDKVNYRTSPPWPGGASSTGFSLQRKNSLLFGNDPSNWAADAPNPGRASVALEDTDGDGMPDAWETANGFDLGDSTDAAPDADGDGVSNLGEYLSGTNPHDVNSLLKIAEIVPYQGTNVAVRFLAYSNTTYSLQYRGSFTNAPNWQRVDDVPPAPENRMVEVPDLNAWKKADRYYRIIAPAVN